MSNAPKKSAAKKVSGGAPAAAPKKAAPKKAARKQAAAAVNGNGEAHTPQVSGPAPAVLLPTPRKRSGIKVKTPKSSTDTHAGGGAVMFDGIICGTNG